jgi:hypothetical protein
LLLGNSGATSTGSTASQSEAGVGSGRYTVRKKSTPKKPAVVDDSVDDSTDDPVVTNVPPPTKTTAPVSAPPASVSPAVEAAKTAQVPVAAPSDARVPTDIGDIDPRKNTLLELSVSSGVMYNNSTSNYSFRNYNDVAPLLGIDGRVWITPSFGLESSYLGTMSDNVIDSNDGHETVPAVQQWFDTGLRFRKFFGTSVLATELIFGIDYIEYDFKVPADANFRDRLESTGVAFKIDADLPTSRSTSWLLGFTVRPRISHSESPTAAGFSSGGNVDANAIGASVGQRYRFDTTNAFFWKFDYSIEKDNFSGTSTRIDPNTGYAPSGVSVSNSFMTLQLGYTWGD